MTTQPVTVRAGRRRPAALVLLLGALAPLASTAFAQAAAGAGDPSRPAIPAPATDQPIVLTPFDVPADKDNSYGALNSNSVTRFNTELDHTPVSADIFDSAFMKDVGATSVEDMIMGYSAGAGSALASPSSSGSSNQGGDRNANSFISLRGLTAPTMQRDGFLPVNTYIQSGSTGTGYTSNYDIERVEVINGPQALLYGVGGAGGVINLVSKQARLGSPAFTNLQFQVDQYGNKLALADYGAGTDRVAVRFDATQQQAQAGRRLYIGGPMQGFYLQLAAKLGKTTFRLTGEQTTYDRIAGTTNQAFTALSTANDARNGQRLRYLLATNQLGAAANGAPSGGGPIGNGEITWDNVDSYGSWLNTEEYTKTRIEMFTADTQWSSWLSSEVALGYRTTEDDRVGNTIVFDAPNVATNPLGTDAVGNVSTIPMSDLSEPVRQKAVRFSVLATNDLWGGRVHSQSILGGDFVRTDGALVTYSYVAADGNFNPTKVNPANATGYTYLPSLFYGANNGPIRYPFWHPGVQGQQHIAYNGVNYTRVLTNVVSPGLISPADPLGVQAGGASALGDYRQGKTINKGIYAANYSQWMDTKLDVLLGVRLGDSYSLQASEAAPPSPPSGSAFLDTKAVSFNAGADYAVLSWLRPYFSVSDSYDPPPIFVAGPTGHYPTASRGLGEEVGLKFTNAAKTISGSVALYHASSKNEETSLTSTLLFEINPNGLNGLSGSPSVWVNVDRATQGAQLALTAQPTPNWRMRLSAAYTSGTIDSTVKFAQLYNDQFYQNASGQVTYRDGTVVYVTTAGSAVPVASTVAGAVPLTVTKLSTVGDPYYANAIAVSGQIGKSTTVAKLLRVVDPSHGPILTGVTGVPIGQMQYNPGFAPPGTITTNVAGEDSTGYPTYSAVFTNHYTIPTGALRGLSLGGTVALGWQYRQFYYYPNGLGNPATATRTLYTWPTQLRFDGIIGYARKLGRKYGFSTQLNINNLFNHYHVLIVPNYTTGFAGPDDATFDEQPRAYVWSTTFSF